MIRATLASYHAISILRGGPNTQLRKTMEYMQRNGVEPSLFDQWMPFDQSSTDLVHLFAANIGTYHLAREVHALQIPLVVSPITFSLHSHSFVRTVLTTTRTLQKAGKGIWSDYGLMSDICGWAARVLPNSREEAELVIHGLNVDKNKVTVIPNGVDERFADSSPELFKKTYGLENFILNVGHIGHRRKNVLSLIKALGKIDHPAVIIGRIIAGEYGDACVREAAKHKHITLIDGLPNDSPMLASAYAAADVFVLPSLFETPGIAALEAGLAGAKIVITPYGGPKEYFGGMADYVQPDDIDDIRKGIENALSRKRSHELRDHIRREFLWQVVSERTASVYKEILGGL